jgi:predicted dehydrogenase
MRIGRRARAEWTGWRVPDETGELRVAVLGAGKMARFHLEALRTMPGVRLAAICNPTSPAGAELAAHFGIESVHRSTDAMLRDAHVDAAIVAVSHAATYDVTARLLAAGVPCLIEKPAGFSSEQTAKLAESAAIMSCPTLVGLNRRFCSTIQQALLTVLQCGPVSGVAIEAHEPIVQQRASGQFAGWLYDDWMMANSIHAIDLFRMICGEPDAVHAVRHARHEPNGDSFSASMAFENGALGSFSAHWHSPKGYALRIFGDGVTAEFVTLERGSIRYDNGRRVELRPDGADIHFKSGVYWQDAAFLQAVCDRAAAPFPASDLADNVRTMRLVEQIAGRTTGAVGAASSH